MSESAERYDCPAEGCPFTGNLDAVCGHHAGKNDPDHYGGFQMVREHLAEGKPMPDAQPEPEPDPNPRAGSAAEPEEPAANPTFGAADPTREPDPDVDDDPDGLELPCGHETVDRADLPELPCNVTCDECGQTWGLRA